MYRFYFEKLEVWQNARILLKDIYEMTNDFPAEEKYGITSQMRRATLSIGANIAEGFSRNTNKDRARFINQAYSSTIEVISFLILSNDLHYLQEENYIKLREQAEHITNQLNALYKKLTN